MILSVWLVWVCGILGFKNLIEPKIK